jgi:hypothetical protein
MLEEERMEVVPAKRPTAADTVIIEQEKPTVSTTYPPTTSIRPLGALPAGINPTPPPATTASGPTAVGATFSSGETSKPPAPVSMFNKFKNLGNEDDLINKLKNQTAAATSGTGSQQAVAPKKPLGGLKGMPI